METRRKAVKYKMRKYVPCLMPCVSILGFSHTHKYFIAGQNVKSGKIEVET